ncbi:hypothetical protein MKJ04_13615 [Pontibacter sp. E15-1]|uniref:hypothetical protein n=1 Tax=Pontibacter sp. E15-1 TaxID=2919918 RepID=UPI001F4FB61A|nr:hypothetical protein [Pontibacter sp. E15-1]MCJ8165884.1 hypothetical protein [Pontibacter sp. E15-1]
MKKILLPVLAAVLGLAKPALAQQTSSPLTPAAKPKSELRYNLTEDGSKYIKATFLAQVWLRWNDSNPGTTVNGDLQDNTVDIGLRRTRMQLYGQLSDHVFFYTQFGMNNFNYLAQNAGNRKLQAFFHDALAEYKVFKDSDMLKLGGGLTITGGLSRFSQPSIGTIMTTDVPVFAQATVDQTDEFGRKLSVYARGQVGKLDYRVALTDPFPVQTNGQTAPPLGPNATFTTFGHTKQYQGLLVYNFLDKEPHTTPYMTGTYLGDRRILNLEGGMIYQRDATWHTNNGVNPVYENMTLWSVAAFADMPLQENKYALSAYAGYFNTDYGKNYIRNNGLMNPANGNSDASAFNGAGNAYPMFGTGETLYTQVGLRLPNELLGDQGTLLPYASYRRSSYDRLEDPVNVYDAGINWLLSKHQSKLSLNYQVRPVYAQQANGDVTKASNASSAWLQYQVYF